MLTFFYFCFRRRCAINTLEFKLIPKSNQCAVQNAVALLEKQGLFYERTVTATYGVFERDSLIATGSLFGNVLKMIAVASEHQGTDVINTLMTGLINEAHLSGQHHLFLYTHSDKIEHFRHFGFYKVEETDRVALLENRPDGLQQYLKELCGVSEEKLPSAGIVVNCNPFTKGHRYLIEEAAQDNRPVHVFVLWENLSLFPSDVRYRLVVDGVKDLPNVTVHWAKDYIISSATFPAYFIGDEESVIREQAALDAKIFGQHIAKALNITTRYLGEEPFNPVTRKYNEALMALLPRYGIAVSQIPRVQVDGEAVSASAVRRLLVENRWEELRMIVPDTTWNYLNSDEANGVIQSIHLKFNKRKLV